MTDEFNEGYEAGLQDGKKEGYDSGYEIGLKEGYTEGTESTTKYLVDTHENQLALVRSSMGAYIQELQLRIDELQHDIFELRIEHATTTRSLQQDTN